MEQYLSGFGLVTDPKVLFPLGLGFSVLLIAFGLFAAIAGRDPVADRMRAASGRFIRDGKRRDLLRSPDKIPEGVLKAIIPEDRTERTQIKDQLRRAGFDGPNTVRNFFLMRLALAMFLPIAAVIFFSIREFVGVPSAVDEWLNGFTNLRVIQSVAVATAAGFYTPTIWLKRRIRARQQEIRNGFPNALDLLQISTRAGLGFDAAMTRVGQKLALVCPSVSEEFLLYQAEVLAGRDRKQALKDMAERMGVDEINGFTQVVAQSMEYGTSISDALTAYSVEMRQTRELAAIEKANRLPVQMSGVMASMMLPALFLITLGPTVIRYIQVFGGD